MTCTDIQEKHRGQAFLGHIFVFLLFAIRSLSEWSIQEASESCAGGVLWALREKKTIQLPRKTKVGYGLYVGHNGPIIINPTAVIGNNVNLSQFTTIGSSKGQAAQIGDNVWIGPNVCVVENVKIGNNASIGAGSIVTKDIPENATAVGNYAKVINFDNPGIYITNRFIDY